ncbi:ATP-binding protein [Hyphobacterium sp. HN65]|uniref:histidine kinase n=1 Tax=Hyphobacterium lacteum TaxID=3116575 RepID=A0ABU7LNH4_9PROT|nr:ATP-binding protein [Hyphobacterium sp. HN65]MEE2525470.1 ATP-binding protein [Hyphobacterium sp. HN65]
MQAAIYPENESERQAALNDLFVLDTPEDTSLDDLTALAAALVGADIALISLVDNERQWFKSRVGLDISETPRDISFCGHAIHSDEVFSIPDALNDERFADNPLVTGQPNIRAYFGIPLKTATGFRIGTLCTIFREPKKLEDNQITQLRILARAAVDRIESRRSDEKLKRYAAQLSIISDIQAEFISQPGNRTNQFDSLLDAVIRQTDGEYGFIGEIHTDDQGTFLRTHAITDISWNAETREFYQQHVESGLEFRNLDTLFGYVIRTGELVLENSPANHPSAAGIPHGHPPLNSFMGVPLFRGKDLIGMVGVANRPGGFDQQTLKDARPLLNCIAAVIIGDAAHKALVLARDEAERANIAKSEFVATMSHEIRTPMNGVLGMLQLLGRSNLEDTQMKWVGIASQSAESLLTIIDDVLDHSKLEAGKMELEAVEFPPHELSESVLELLKIKAEEKGLSCKLDIADDVPPLFVSDPTRIRQVLYNILGNAVKFTETGSVTLKVEATPVQPFGGLKFSVIDTGIGIDANQQSKLFQPFAQADSSTTRQFGGTGLGLTISRRLTEGLGGTIELSSVAGKGTTFTVELPGSGKASGAIEAQAVEEKDETFRPLRILVAEDNLLNQNVIRGLLGNAHELTICGDGEEVQTIASKQSFDLILMDIHLPKADGITATANIKAKGSAVPIVALTADTGLATLTAGERNGFDGVVLKPFKVRQLYEEISRVLIAAQSGTDDDERFAAG